MSRPNFGFFKHLNLPQGFIAFAFALVILGGTSRAFAQVGQIVLDSPTNGAINQILSPTLIWNPDAVANYYRVQVSVDSFATVRVDSIIAKSGQLKESLQLGSLGNDSVYYWHVSGRTTPAGGTVGAWSSIWNFRTLPTQPLAPTLVSPATGSTSLPLVDTLRWNAVATADSYHVQISTTSGFASLFKDTIVVKNASQQVQYVVIGGFANSVTYYWRVYSRNTAGDSKSPSAAWSFTTIVAAPGIPGLSIPAAGAASVDTASLSFTWTAAPGATTYRLQVASDSLFTSPVYDDSALTTTSKSITPPPQTNTRYYWRVRAKNVGGVSGFSAWRTFTTSLRQPQLAAPAMNAQNQPVALLLNWNTVAGASLYWVQLSTSATFATRLVDTTLAPDSLAVVGLANNTTYYWRVRAASAKGDTSKFPTTAWNFKSIVASPSTPSLLLPASGAVSQPISTLAFSWSPATDAATYRIQIGTDSTFATGLVVNDSTVATTSKTVSSGLANNTRYYWHVQAKNVAGTGAYSTLRSFATLLAQPGIVSPAVNALNQPLALTLDWTPVAGASVYRIQMSTTSTFASVIFDQSIAVDTLPISGLANNTNYYWRVSARDGLGDTSSFPTTPWSFKTIVAAPGTPTLSAPAQNIASMPLTGLMLSWGAVTDAATYRVQVATDSLFVSLVVNDSTIASPTRTITGLSYATRYFWRVNAKNVAGTGPYSLIRTFTTILPQPAIVSPASGTGNLPISVALDWTSVAQASSYRVQVSTASTFATLLVNSVVAGDSLALTALSNNTKYYWRVSAINANGDTSAYPGTPWNFTTQLAAPVLSTPVNGASNLSLNPVLSWSKPGGADSCRVQVSVDSTFPAGLNLDMWTGNSSISVGPLEPSQRFYWHVMARGLAGTSSSLYSETRFFNTSVDTPAAPVLLSPANGALDQPIGLTLSWKAATGAATYSVQVAKYPDSLFTASIIDGAFQAGTSRSLSGLTNMAKYYWRVRGMNAAGLAMGAYSSTWNFTTIIDTPGVPIPISPAMAAPNQPAAVTLLWHTASSAFSYKVEVSKNSSMTPIDTTMAGLADTSAVLPRLALSTQYFWRVKAANSLGEGSFSPIWNFTTTIASPVLLAPANDTTGQQTDNLVLAWNPVPGAARYRLQLAVDSLFTMPLIDDSSLITTSRVVNGLSISSQYYWRLQAKNATNAVTTSPTWRFTTVVIVPAVPVLRLPADSAQNVPLAVTASWYQAIGAAKYRLQLSKDPGFSSVAFEDSTAGTSMFLPGLTNATNYFWRVQARNGSGPSAFTAARQFTTIVAAPAKPVLLLPTNGSNDVAASPTLSWNPAAGAIHYRMQISTLSDFTSYILDDSTITGTTRTVGPLPHNVTCYWRLAAVNAGGTSQYSLTWSFTTIIDTPATVQLSLPVNASVNLPSAETLQWNLAARASAYHVQLSTDIAFGSVLVNDTTLTSTTLAVGPYPAIPGMTQYYWRVRARNAAGWGAFSPVWNYRTLISTPTIASPLNGEAGVPTSPRLLWHPVAGAGRYRVQLAMNPAFTPLIAEDSTVTDSSKKFGQLSGASQYYWRVNAQNVDGSSISPYSSTYSFTTAPDTPGTVILASPLAGTINVATTPTFAWRSTPIAQSYRLQIAADTSFAAVVFDDSTLTDTTRKSMQLSGLTKYAWRVRGQNGAACGPYSVPRTFTTTIATPVLTAPADGSQQLPLSVTLRWIPVDSAVTYRIQLSTDSLFATTVLDDSTVATSSRPVTSLVNSVKYFWRVRSRSRLSSVSAYSAVFRFTTVLQAPPVVVLSGPATGAMNQVSPVLLRWKSALRADTYRVQVSDNVSFANIVLDDSTVTDTSREFTPPLSLTWFYWRVRASNAGGTSAYSTAWTMKSIATMPVLSSPTNGIIDQPISVILKWNASYRAYRYKVQVSTDSTFQTRIIDDSLITTTSRAVASLANSTQFYWRVAALDTQLVSRSAFSDPWSFQTIIATPTTPPIVSPTINAVDQPTALVLRWRKVLLADTYRVQVATDSSFMTKVKDDSTLVDTLTPLGGLNPMTKYYWRVRATNHGGSSAFSSAFGFTTSIAIPTLASPADGTVDQPRSVTFRWNAVTGAKTYRLQVSPDSLFQTTSFDDSTLATTSRTVTPLVNATEYFWRVRAKNTDGSSTSAFTGTWGFTTIIDTPSTPQLVGPVDNLVNVSTVPVFRWRSCMLAATYDLTIASDSLFKTVVFRDSLLTDTTRQPATLPALTKMWWKVRARDHAGYGSYSPMWRLTTMIATPRLTAPADSAVEQAVTLALTWQAISGATMYRFQLATDSLFTALVVDDSTLASPRRDVTGLIPFTQYYWKVRAISPKSTGEYSATSHFMTLLVLAAAPSLVAPGSGETALMVTHTLQWHPVRLAQFYHVQVSTDTPFLTTVIDDSTCTDTLRVIGPQNYLTKYYWRVRALNAKGAGTFSPVWSYTTIVEAPPEPVLVSPPSAATDQSVSVTLRWLCSPRAQRYHVQVATDAPFSSIVLDDTTVTDTMRLVGPLDNNTTYYWRVSALNAGWTTGYSPVWNYATAAPPSTFALVQNYPNPFNPTTMIPYEIPVETDVTLTVYNILGQVVRVLVEGKVQKVGRYEVKFDAEGLGSGAYFYRIKAGNFTSTKKLMILR